MPAGNPITDGESRGVLGDRWPMRGWVAMALGSLVFPVVYGLLKGHCVEGLYGWQYWVSKQLSERPDQTVTTIPLVAWVTSGVFYLPAYWVGTLVLRGVAVVVPCHNRRKDAWFVGGLVGSAVYVIAYTISASVWPDPDMPEIGRFPFADMFQRWVLDGHESETVHWVMYYVLQGVVLLPLFWSAVGGQVISGRLVRGWRPGYCARCGYDLRGNASGICSECGLSIDRCRS